MPSQYEISIIVKAATQQAQRELKGFGGSLDQLKSIAKTAMFAMGGYVGIQTLRTLSDLADMAAANMEVADSFERLADRYGVDSIRIVEALKRASKGTVSEQDLILQANKALRLGVATTVEEFEDLMKVAYVRAKEFGISVADAWQYIVTGIGRASPMILDNIGILMDAERTFKDYADSIGKTSDELTVYEKKEAIRSRILQESAGDLRDWAQMQDTAADKIARTNTEVDEAKQKIGEYAAVVKGELAVALVEAAEAGGQAYLIYRGIVEGTYAASHATEEYRGWLGRVALATEESTQMQRAYNQAFRDAIGLTDQQIQKNKEASLVARDWDMKMQDAARDARELAASQDDLSEATDDAAKAADRAKDIWHDYASDVAEENWQLAHQLEELGFRQGQAAEDAAFALYEIEQRAADRRTDLWEAFELRRVHDVNLYQMQLRWMTRDFHDEMVDAEWDYQQERRDMLDNAPWYIRQALVAEFAERKRIEASGDKAALRDFDKALQRRIEVIDPVYAELLERLQQRYEHEKDIEQREYKQGKRREGQQFREDQRDRKAQMSQSLRELTRGLDRELRAWAFHDQQRQENERWAMDNLIQEHNHQLDTMYSDTEYRLSRLDPLYKHYGYTNWLQYAQGWNDGQADYPLSLPSPGGIQGGVNPIFTAGAQAGGVNVSIGNITVGAGATPSSARQVTNAVASDLGQRLSRLR